MGASKELGTVDRIVSPNIGRIHSHLVGCTLRAVSRDTWRHCLGFVPTAVVARRLDPATGREAPRHTLIALSLLSSTTRPSPLATACIATSASRCPAPHWVSETGFHLSYVAMAFAPASCPALQMSPQSITARPGPITTSPGRCMLHAIEPPLQLSSQDLHRQCSCTNRVHWYQNTNESLIQCHHYVMHREVDIGGAEQTPQPRLTTGSL